MFKVIIVVFALLFTDRALAMDLYILAGQSNMSGRDSAASLPSFPNASHVHVFGNDWQWHNPGAEPVDIATNQELSVGIDTAAGASPGMAFADRMYTLRGNDVGLIPCAKGGSSIEEWQQSYSYWSLYGACLASARLASEQGTIKGLVYWGNETNAQSTAKAMIWSRYFSNFVRDIRADLNAPLLPVVFAQLSKNPTTRAAEFPAWADLKTQQWGTRDTYLSMIQTDDLPVMADEIHVTAAGMVTAGTRFADAMHALPQ